MLSEVTTVIIAGLNSIKKSKIDTDVHMHSTIDVNTAKYMYK